MTNAHRSLVASVGLALLAGCLSPSAPTETTTSQEPLVINRALGTGALGFFFLPPISSKVPPHFDGVFAADLSPTVRVDQVQFPSGATIATVATLTATDRTVRRHPWREFYIARFDTHGLSPKNHYRIRVLVEDKELGAADLAVIASASDAKSIDTSRFTPVVVGMTLPIKFRVERSAADQDGDGVPDWLDNCPTIYNPPVKAPPLPPRPVTPPRCDYNKSNCDPQELDCLLIKGVLKQPDVCSCPGNGTNCPAPDACHTAGMCDPTTGIVRPDRGGRRNALLGRERLQRRRDLPERRLYGRDGPQLRRRHEPVHGRQLRSDRRLSDGHGGRRHQLLAAQWPGRVPGRHLRHAHLRARVRRLRWQRRQRVRARPVRRREQLRRLRQRVRRLLRGGGVHRDLGVGRRRVGTASTATRSSSPPRRPPVTTTRARRSASRGAASSPTPASPCNAGATYCLTAWVRGSGGASPFVGIQISDAAGNFAGVEHWLIGMPGYTTGYANNDTVTPVVSDGNWGYYAKSFTMDAGTSDVLIKDENFGSGESDFDVVQLWAGACPSAPTSICAAPSPSCQSPICGNGVCSSSKL